MGISVTSESEVAEAKATAARLGRYVRRFHARNLAPARGESGARLAGCGRFSVSSESGLVVVRTRVLDSGRPGAYYDGLQTCASVWSCPVCSAKIRQRRAVEIQHAVTASLGRARGVLFVTLTARHGRGDDVAALLDAVIRAWGRTTSGLAWHGCEEGCTVEHEGPCVGGCRDCPAGCEVSHLRPCDGSRHGDGVACGGRHREAGSCVRGSAPCDVSHRGLGLCEPGDVSLFGIIGAVRSIEVTYGHANGFHPHVHALVVTERPLGVELVAEFERRLFARWSAALGAVDESWVPDRAHGIKVLPVTVGHGIGQYLAGATDGKESLLVGLEMTRHDLKEGRHGDRFTPYQILDAAGDGEAWAVRAWQSYVRATLGRQCMTWSGDLRAEVGLGHEATDEELVAEDQGGAEVLSIPVPTWREVVRRPGLDAQILRAVELGGEAAAVVLLREGLGRAPACAPDRRVRGPADQNSGSCSPAGMKCSAGAAQVQHLGVPPQ